MGSIFKHMEAVLTGSHKLKLKLKLKLNRKLL